MQAKISIVIVTWNIKDIFKKCLSSIDRYADLPYELFVIDNNSEDGTKDLLANYHPTNLLLTKFEVIYNPRNVGLSQAANKGMKRVSGEYVLLLNPDTQFLEPSFSKMISIARAIPKLGMLGFKIISPNGKIQWSISRLPGVWRQVESRLGLWKPHFDYNKFQETEQINASVALMPKKVLDEVGLWDDGFFIWFEENDFCFRARQAGYKIYYSPEVSIMHESQAGISKIPMWKRQLIWEQSMFRYFRKHHGILAAIAACTLDSLCMFVVIGIKKMRRIV